MKQIIKHLVAIALLVGITAMGAWATSPRTAAKAKPKAKARK